MGLTEPRIWGKLSLARDWKTTLYYLISLSSVAAFRGSERRALTRQSTFTHLYPSSCRDKTQSKYSAFYSLPSKALHLVPFFALQSATHSAILMLMARKLTSEEARAMQAQRGPCKRYGPAPGVIYCPRCGATCAGWRAAMRHCSIPPLAPVDPRT